MRGNKKASKGFRYLAGPHPSEMPSCAEFKNGKKSIKISPLGIELEPLTNPDGYKIWTYDGDVINIYLRNGGILEGIVVKGTGAKQEAYRRAFA